MSKNRFQLPAFAKINWFLDVLGKRDDGFHEIRTAFQTVSLYDNLTFEESDEIILTCDKPDIPVGEGNLIVRAAVKLKEKFAVEKGAKIHLEKLIPSPGGLGGGSSDAGCALFGLSKLWKIKINFNELGEIAETLGSDVPFFLSGGTAIGTGRGTEITSIEDAAEKFLLIVTPNVEISTAVAYARLNAPRLTNFPSKSILQICRNAAGKQHRRQSNLKNDFEAVVFKIAPEIARVKERLLETGAETALMSGSGASVFGIFDNEETRQATIKALENESSWRRFAVATVSRAEYRRRLTLKVVSD